MRRTQSDRSRRFPIAVPQQQLDDLARRLATTIWPPSAAPGWEMGTDPVYLRDLVDYWQNGFDWRARERWLEQVLPSRAAIAGGLRVHFARVAGKGPRPFPLLLLHGWPSSFVEMHRLAALLADPGAHGADPEDAFEVIVPSLPGHGLSEASAVPEFGADDAADLLCEVMVRGLGHTRFGVHGGDRGALTAAGLAHRHPRHVAGIHLPLVMGIPAPLGERSREEERWLADMQRWQVQEGGYSVIQSTRPQSLAYALTDSPVGLAAWIIEKWYAWSDCDGDVERSFTRDDLLTNIMIYWITRSIGSSIQYYWAHRASPPVWLRHDRIDVPTGIAMFPKGMMHPPRSAVERKYNVTRWTEMARGGHFPALETPDELAHEIRAFFRELR